MKTLEVARKLGFQLRTWRSYLGELVSHLKGPVLLEWINNFQNLPTGRIESMLRTAPTLIKVFHEWVEAQGGLLESIVEEIIGKTNAEENAAEFLKEEFGIETQELPAQGMNDQEEWSRVFGIWLEGKKRHNNMSEDRFELSVRNDVNSYLSIVKLRRETKAEGPNYGQKIWYLTLDQMPWRIAKSLARTEMQCTRWQ